MPAFGAFAPLPPGASYTTYPVEPGAQQPLAAGTRIGLTVYVRAPRAPGAEQLGDMELLVASYFAPATSGPTARVVSAEDARWQSVEVDAKGALRESWPDPATFREAVLDNILSDDAAFYGDTLEPDAQTRERAVALGLLDKPRTVTTTTEGPPPDESYLESLGAELPGAAAKSFGAIANVVGETAGSAARATVGGAASGIASGLGVVGVLVVLAVVALGVVLLIIAFRAGWL